MEEDSNKQEAAEQQNLADWFPEQQPVQENAQEPMNMEQEPCVPAPEPVAPDCAPAAAEEKPQPETTFSAPQETSRQQTEPEEEDSRLDTPAFTHGELPLQQPKEIINFELPNEPFAKILQQIRMDAEVSIKEVSDKTRISATFINDLEQENFAALPSFELCLAKIEQLCLEYDVDSKLLIDKFSMEYHEHKKDTPDKGQTTHLPYAFSKRGPGNYLQTRPSRLPGLPAIFIGTVLILIIGLLSYAFYAYRTHQMPERLDSDLTEHIPLHEPKVILLDEIKP